MPEYVAHRILSIETIQATRCIRSLNQLEFALVQKGVDFDLHKYTPAGLNLGKKPGK